ncbi:MAG TPA: dNTP triphosphohydrolase [Bryobacteraceae bacterium]|jgi:dGTPase|nr:dNTP triphosphohydrolase [Bryobacteraceae bacterium]
MLAHLGFPVEASRGRRYPEPAHPYRSVFQRDRDRIIHTRAFRRLENKTQVFAPAVSDHFRNRLTHTLEVSQVARTVAGVLGLNEDLTEALALVHDVGHPPFAHAGEEALNREMQKFGARFDHNLHALRIVELLEHRYPRFPGLNLTFEVREGIVKHSRDFGPGEFPELDEYLPGLRPPLEAQLIDLADEVAYNTADLDDGFEAGLIRPQQIAEAVPAWAEIFDTVETQYPGASEREQFQEALRGLFGLLVSGLIEGTIAAAQSSGVRNVVDVRHHPQRIAQFSSHIREVTRQIKSFLYENLYCSPELGRDRLDSMARLVRAFELLVARGEDYRSVCDFISGMTDRYFLRYYESLNPAGA